MTRNEVERRAGAEVRAERGVTPPVGPLIRRRARAAVAVAAMVAATFLTPSSASAYTSTQHMIITGHGWGHGHGMSQYGARGAATQGLDYKKILGFYYPRTTWGAASTALIRVLLAEVTTNDLMVRARSSLTASWRGHTAVWNLGQVRPDADMWRIVPAGAGQSALKYHVGATWTTYQVVTGELDFYALGNPMSMAVPGGWRSYRGTLGAVLPTPTSSTRLIVDTLQLEQYLLGVVPSEMPSSWPTEALKAQVVAARTYAAYEMRTPVNPEYHVYDDTRSQVYRGFSVETTTTNAATAATKGQVLTYGGTPAFTEFHSSDGGYELASSNGEPYLPSQADPYEKYGDNPNATWTASISIAALLKQCPAAGSSITKVTSSHYPPAINPWISRIYIFGPASATTPACTFYGYEFRVNNGLKSANFGFHVS